jgi:tRNA(fMet)-specific endonuclease VapC
VDDALILETTFLVDLERERLQGEEGPAHRFLADNRGSRVYVTFTTTGELAAGPRLEEREAWERFLQPFQVLPWTLDVAWEYGRVYRHLADDGRLIGANDLWIGATALANHMPVVTANAEHFRRIPHLRIRTYPKPVAVAGRRKGRGKVPDAEPER